MKAEEEKKPKASSKKKVWIKPDIELISVQSGTHTKYTEAFVAGIDPRYVTYYIS